MINRLVGINLNGASVNMGRKHGAATLLKELLSWLEVVHCFNHKLKLALKDAFQDIKSFQMIDEMLMKTYYLYQKLPKMLRELKAFSNALERAVPKPSKTYGTCWIEHKFHAMEILLSHNGTHIANIESLKDFQVTKRAELREFLKKWKHASFLIHTSSIRHLSMAFQQDEHDPVKAVQ